ncbi:MAG: CHAT domain-containing protein [Cyanobacteria bacterium P01_C01_bin.118]
MTASKSSSESLCLWLALDRLTAADPEHYAIWVLKSPYPSGHVHHDRIWSHTLSQAWQTWQSMFSLRGLPQVPHVPSAYVPQLMLDDFSDASTAVNSTNNSYSSRLMQHLGLNLWQWLFDGPVQSSLDHSRGIAQGQNTVMRLRLEVRDPELINVPWEIMQSQPGRPAVALNQQILFSRTTSDVDPLADWGLDNGLKILLVVGHDSGTGNEDRAAATLSLQKEADLLKSILESSTDSKPGRRVVRQVDVLLQPSPADLIQHLERYRYNVFFYAGHGIPAPDGGLLFLQPNATLNGTELAQVLTRCRVKVAVFNTCWGAQPERNGQQAIPRSSLAEVLLHHGVPAVLAMRDSIADEEAISFIQVFAQALAERKSVDEAVAIARQHLLTLYKFNQPAWTLPVLYMHPDFDGELLTPMPTDITRLPGDSGIGGRTNTHTISLREIGGDGKVWPIYRGLMRVGRLPDNDLVIAEPWVSSKHAEIFYRRAATVESSEPTYFLRDFSRYGTYYLSSQGWQQIHRQEIPLSSGMQLRFGSSDGCLLEFIIEPTPQT